MLNLFLISLGVVGLFSTGPGGRHDWMRFHADEVPCPRKGCFGNLKWHNKPTELRCDSCHHIFEIKVTRRKVK